MGIAVFCCPIFAIGEEPISPDAGVPVIAWQDAGKYVDQLVIVQGRVVAARNIGKITFLNFDAARSFSAVIHDRNYKNFPTPPETAYDQKTIRIRGLISEFRDKPQIEITRPDQVRIVDDKDVVPPPAAPPKKVREFTGELTIATLNTLNLFDAHDDPYTADEGTDAKPKQQLEQLAATIHKIDADVLALEEVENRGYLEQFTAAMLGDMGYREVVCFDSNDKRGIDCAILSRFPVGPVTSYRHREFSDGSGGRMRFQRDLLRAKVEPPGAPAFEVFVVHFKSKRGSSTESDRIRLAEATEARKIMDEMLKDEPGSLFLICGDFNDTFDSPSLKMLRGSGATALKDFLSDIPKTTATYNKDPYRSMIDFILASPALGRNYVPQSYKVISGSIEQGGSDHNPVYLRFKLK